MKSNHLEFRLKNNMLEKLVLALDGELPFMTKNDRVKYNNYGIEISNNHEKIVDFSNKIVSNDKQNILMKLITNYEESCTCRNALLNDLYYKDGVRDGVSLILECLK